MAKIYNVVKSPIEGKVGTLNYSSGYEYRDFWYKPNNSNNLVHVVGWHKAVDITTTGTIVAFEKGKVISVVKNVTGQTTNPSGGNQVSLEHANGDRTVYCHLDHGSIPDYVYVGAIVDAGQKLGTDVIKTTGNSTGLHLHFAIYEKASGDNVNPIDYLQGTKALKAYGYTAPVVVTPPQETASAVFSVGDKVQIIGTGNGSSMGRSNTAYGIGWTRYVTRIWTGRPFPYQIGFKNNTTTQGTTGFYTASSLKKL